MIANHKQEVELMNLLREKEKERQKFSLANKVASRKRRRMARKAEMMEKEALKQGKVSCYHIMKLGMFLKVVLSPFAVELTYVMQHIKKGDFAAVGYLEYIWKHSENNEESNKNLRSSVNCKIWVPWSILINEV